MRAVNDEALGSIRIEHPPVVSMVILQTNVQRHPKRQSPTTQTRYEARVGRTRALDLSTWTRGCEQLHLSVVVRVRYVYLTECLWSWSIAGRSGDLVNNLRDSTPEASSIISRFSLALGYSLMVIFEKVILYNKKECVISSLSKCTKYWCVFAITQEVICKWALCRQESTQKSPRVFVKHVYLSSITLNKLIERINLWITRECSTLQLKWGQRAVSYTDVKSKLHKCFRSLIEQITVVPIL